LYILIIKVYNQYHHITVQFDQFHSQSLVAEVLVAVCQSCNPVLQNVALIVKSV